MSKSFQEENVWFFDMVEKANGNDTGATEC
jgi:hypothetical protein